MIKMIKDNRITIKYCEATVWCEPQAHMKTPGPPHLASHKGLWLFGHFFAIIKAL